MRAYSFPFLPLLLLLMMIILATPDSAHAQCFDLNGRVIPCPAEPPADDGDGGGGSAAGDGGFIQGLPGDYDGDGTRDEADLCREASGPNWNFGCPEDIDTIALLQPEVTPEATEEPFFPPTVNGVGSCATTPAVPNEVNLRAWPLVDADIRGQIAPGSVHPVSMIFHIEDSTFYGIEGGWVASAVMNLSTDGSCATVPQYTLHLSPDQWTQHHSSGDIFVCERDFAVDDAPTCLSEYVPVDPLNGGAAYPVMMLVSDHIGGDDPAAFIGGVHVATGDVDGDGIEDTVFGALPEDFQLQTPQLPSGLLGPFSNLVMTDAGQLALAEGQRCSRWRCGYNDISAVMAFDPSSENSPLFMMMNGAARDAAGFRTTVIDAEQGIFALTLTPYGPETGPYFLPAHMIFDGLGVYLAQEVSVEESPQITAELIPLEERAPAGAFLPLIVNEDSYMQWVAQQEPGEAPLVLALRASSEVSNRLAGRPLTLAAETETSEMLVLADEEIAPDDWFVYRAQEVPVSNDLGLDDNSAATPLLSVGTEACNCALMIDFAVPAQPPQQFLGFLRVDIRN